MTPTLKRWLRVGIVVFVVVGTVGAILSMTDDRPAAPAPPAAFVDGPDADRVRDDKIVLTTPALFELGQAVAATEAPGDTHSELSEPLREGEDGPVVTNEGPLAAQELDGCRTRFVGNSSSRNGAAVRIIVWHQTVSRDRPGVADQDGLTAFANRPSSGVSWHALIGGIDGLCTFNVPLTLKAWTQGNANPFSVGIEVQAFGDEPQYVRGAGRAKLLGVTRTIAKRYGIPLRRGKVTNCRPVRAGIVEHADLGACGGGHIDVTATGAGAASRAAGWDIDPLIRALASGGVTAQDRVTCRKLNAWRAAGRPHGGAWERRSIIRKATLTKRGVNCTSRGPVKA